MDKKLSTMKRFIIGLVITVLLFLLFKNSEYFFVNHKLFIYNWHWIVSVLCGIYGFLWTFKDDSKFMKIYKDKLIVGLILRLSFLFFLPLIIATIIATFLFYPLHKLVEKKDKLYKKLEYVSSKSHTEKTGQRYCIKVVKDLDISFKNKICGNKELYHNLEIKDSFILIGTKSIFGFDIKQFEYDKKIKD